MRAPISWVREYARLDPSVDSRQLYEALIRAGLEVETIDKVGPQVSGPIVVGRVLSVVDEPQKNGKTIRWCRVDCGPQANATASEPDAEGGSRGIVCGASNFTVGQNVVVSLPGAVLPGGFEIAARKTYGHISDGMICAEDELGIGDDHAGILVLPETDDDGRALVPGEPAIPLIAVLDEVLDIAVTPDIGYCLSIRGIAREAAQAFGAPFTDPAGLAKSPKKCPPSATLQSGTFRGPQENKNSAHLSMTQTTNEADSAGFPVRLDTPGCPLFVAVSVEGVDPSRLTPLWMRSRLKMAGMRSLGLAIDITNYVMLEFGQPIHGYDADRLSDGIVVRQARPGEHLVTLDNVDRTLDPADIVITDGSGVIGLAGVMGGQTTELEPTTTAVVIEAAYFDPTSIARTAKRHKLPSEASRRFERGVDPGAAYAAAHRVADLLVELGGGRKLAAETVAGAVPEMPTQTIAAELPSRILGHPVPQAQVEAILRASGVQVSADAATLRLVPPTWRPDLVDPYDYVEEVGRKIGFDVVEPVVPLAPAGRGRTPAQRVRKALSWVLPTAGFTEVISFPFSSTAEVEKLGVGADDPRLRMVRLANPLADTSPQLRTTLLPGLFGAIARNRSRSLDDLVLYEQGLVFFGPAGVAPIPGVEHRPSTAELAAIEAALPSQPRHLACVLAGNWLTGLNAVPSDWSHAVAFAELAAKTVGLELAKRAVEHAPWHPGRCAELSVDGQVIGYAGELHPNVLTAYGLPPRVSAAELDLDALIAAAPGAGQLPSLSTFPVAKEDVALIVDADLPQSEVAAALREGAGELLESLALFDVYTGEQIEVGKKSLAFAL
ncbi:MAG: phenylalanine--tRNA ligase subunit beta, partial [Propionibacteriaceae bacterium]|nr:phenylalanine--tRNA ligase subunit beta [Propionibacteriaceae bacterium]